MGVQTRRNAMEHDIGRPALPHRVRDQRLARGRLCEDHLLEQAVLASEQFVDRRQRSTGTLDDIAERRALESLIYEQRQRGIDDRPPPSVQTANFGIFDHLCIARR